jgi:hypothetical protein
VQKIFATNAKSLAGGTIVTVKTITKSMVQRVGQRSGLYFQQIRKRKHNLWMGPYNHRPWLNFNHSH